LRVNLKGVFLTGQAAARQMVKQGRDSQGRGGSIINMSSVNAELAIPAIAPYVVAKGGVKQLTKVMALSLVDQGIRVNAVGPGSIKTEVFAAVASDKEKMRGILMRTPMGRAGEPLPPSDVVTGFGLVDWLEREECLRFFRNIKDRTFMFSYSDQDGSFDEIIHHFYLVERLRLFGGGVRAYHHPRATIEGRLRKCNITNFEIVSRKEMRFGRLVHNLPTAKRNRTTRNG
ncbi:MAG TPA: SDR family oxidoreductase, partial [Candidatus Sumerlaeota bacterium]|nr:SDR family oxidoreductase [Candidatus Sumerlaeota bacterium]